MSKSRSQCFTLNNYTESDVNLIQGLENVKYVCFGKELAPTTGTPHLQGYVYFSAAKSISAACKSIPRASFRACKGTPSDNINYCSKSGDFFEKGKRPVDNEAKGSQERDRWVRIIELARSADYEIIKEEFPDVYATRLPALENLHRKRPIHLFDMTGELTHEWYVGATGTGKSYMARKENPGAYIKDPETPWWDDYDHQSTVIIDDFDKYQKGQGGNMKRWLDRYIFPAQIKGGYMRIRPTKIVVTSQYHPSEIWDDEKTVSAILRRVTIYEFSKDPPSPKTPPKRARLEDLSEDYGVPGRVVSHGIPAEDFSREWECLTPPPTSKHPEIDL